MKKYDGLYILPDQLKEDEALKAWDSIKSELQKAGGVISAEKPPSRRSFARTLAKKRSGYYAEVAFELDPGHVDGLLKRHKLDERIFRVMIAESSGRGLLPDTAPSDEPQRSEM